MANIFKEWEVYDDVRSKVMLRLEEIRSRVHDAEPGLVPSPITLRIAEMYEFLALLDDAPTGIGR